MLLYSSPHIQEEVGAVNRRLFPPITLGKGYLSHEPTNPQALVLNVLLEAMLVQERMLFFTGECF
jgi:hypothetical protein